MADQFTEPVWYLVSQDAQEPQGPFSLRDIDVKFRISEITTQFHGWKEGMAEWLPIFDIPDLKQVLQDSTQEQDQNINNEDANEKEPYELQRKLSIQDEAKDITQSALELL